MADLSAKQQLRAQALRRRDAMDPIERVEASLALASQAASIAIEPGGIVAGYMPIRSEIDPRPLMHVLAEHGARLCSPATIDRTTIVFRELVRDAALVQTGFGTVGPGPEAAVVQPDLILLPLAAFDPLGNRLGYGAGHYDRAIAALHEAGRRPRLIGLAFAAQEIAAIPAGPHDVRLDAVLTENSLRRFEPPA